MATIKGTPATTFDADVGLNTVYYDTAHSLDILNCTDDEILVSDSNPDFDDGEYFIIPSGCSYTGFRTGSYSRPSALYIYANSAGKVSILWGRY